MELLFKENNTYMLSFRPSPLKDHPLLSLAFIAMILSFDYFDWSYTFFFFFLPSEFTKKELKFNLTSIKVVELSCWLFKWGFIIYTLELFLINPDLQIDTPIRSSLCGKLIASPYVWIEVVYFVSGTYTISLIAGGSHTSMRLTNCERDVVYTRNNV